MNKLLIVFLLILGSTDPSDIARKNRLKSKAETAFEHGQYEVAAANYRQLYDSLGVTDPAIALNLAHSYYALNDSANARLKYQAVASSDNSKLKSIAFQQLGVMAKTPRSLNESLNYLKSAIKADPTNEEARYNYEVVKKLIEEQKKNQDQNKKNQDQNKDQDQQQKDQQDKDQQNKDQQNKDQQEQGDKGEQDQQEQNQEKKDSEKQDGQKGKEEQKPEEQQQQEGEQSEDEQNKDQQNQNMSTKQKLEQMNISEEKAKMILEAMKNNEIQFIQQQKRKATKSPDSGKPDW